MSRAKYIVFDPEGSEESVYYCDVWDDSFEDAWDAGHLEIIDITVFPPRRYAGVGSWEDLSHWVRA